MSSHSSIVKMKLTVNDQSYKVGQLGPDFIILNETPRECPPTSAGMFLSIDGVEESWQVFLPEGLSEAWKEIPICEVPSSNPAKLEEASAVSVS